MFTVHILHKKEHFPTMLDTFERSQKTTKVLYYEQGTLIEKEDVFEDNWTLEKKREIARHLKQTIEDGGAVIVAKRGTQVIGFAVVEATEFGSQSKYRELSYLHVTHSARGQRVGESLFVKAKEIAKLLGAEKLYIGAHPSVETQHFYRRMGCVLAVEVDKQIYNREIRDIQLEVTL